MNDRLPYAGARGHGKTLAAAQKAVSFIPAPISPFPASNGRTLGCLPPPCWDLPSNRHERTGDGLDKPGKLPVAKGSLLKKSTIGRLTAVSKSGQLPRFSLLWCNGAFPASNREAGFESLGSTNRNQVGSALCPPDPGRGGAHRPIFSAGGPVPSSDWARAGSSRADSFEGVAERLKATAGETKPAKASGGGCRNTVRRDQDASTCLCYELPSAGSNPVTLASFMRRICSLHRAWHSVTSYLRPLGPPVADHL